MISIFFLSEVKEKIGIEIDFILQRVILESLTIFAKKSFSQNHAESAKFAEVW